MADPGLKDEHKEILIVRRHSNHDDAHHGGAWKIAFADFMTAMMALFLVLWLISSTSEKTKHTVAQYFNPVKLVDMSTLQKGFRDPKETEMGSGSSPKEPQSESEARTARPLPGKMPDANPKPEAKAAPDRDAALFRDPYAVLAEIAASASQSSQSSPAATGSETPAETEGAFADPFTTVPHEPEKPPSAQLPLAQGKDASLREAKKEDRAAAAGDAGSARPQGREESLETQNAPRAGGAQRAPEPVAEEAAKLKTGILQALGDGPHPQGLPHIEVRETAEGILISLTDDANFSMFAIGSAEPRPETVQAMEKIGRILKAGSGPIVIRGHTDGRPYRSAVYDNWRLSSARAQMALYMLARGGVSETRVERVEGYADRRLKSPNNPNGSENRRIEILLRKDKP